MSSSSKKKISLGIILSYFYILVKLITGILYTPIVLHSLGRAQYGVFSLCVSFIGYLTILNAGVDAAYIRFYVQRKTLNTENVDELNGLFLKIFVVLSVLGFLGGLLLSYFSPTIFGAKIMLSEYKLLRRCFIWLSFTIAVEIFTGSFRAFVIANEEFVFCKLIDILVAIFLPLFTLPFLLRGYDCTSIIKIRLVLSVLTLILDVVFCRKRLNMLFLFKKADRALLADISQFVGFIALQSVTDQLNWQIDKFILAWTHGTSEISIYSLGGMFNTYFLMVGAAASGVFIARINRLIALNDNEHLNNLFRKTSKLFTYIVGFIIAAFIVLGKTFVLRWAGGDYDKSFTVGWMLMSPVALALIMGLGQNIARAKNKHQLQIVIDIIVCIVNVLFSIPLAIYWGAVGSALGTFISEIIMCIIIQPIYYKKVLGLNVKNIFLDIARYLPGFVASISVGFLIVRFGWIGVSYKSIILSGLIFAVIYCICIFLFSMNREARYSILTFVRKRI